MVAKPLISLVYNNNQALGDVLISEHFKSPQLVLINTNKELKMTEKTNHGLKKTCRKHGELPPDLIRAQTCKLKDGSISVYGGCRLCHRETAGQWRNRDRAAFNAKMAEDRLKNPEKWKKEYQRSYSAQKRRGGDRYSLLKVLKERKVNVDQYEKILKKQGNKCAICSQPESRIDHRKNEPMRLVIDHCHETKEFRGLICHRCNIVLGCAKDSEEILSEAIKYLKAFKKKLSRRIA